MSTLNIETFSDALFAMEQRGCPPEDAKAIAIQIFGWGISAAFDRMRPTRPTPGDLPAVGNPQLSLLNEPAPAPAAVKPKPKKPAAPRMTPHTWPEGFALDEGMKHFATNRGFNEQQITRMWEKFRDRNLARGEKYADWRAAWRTWVNNQIEFAKRDSRDPDRPGDGRL